MIYLSSPEYDISSLFSAVSSPVSINSIYKEISKFEKSLKHALNTNNSIFATNSGTSALHLALKLADVNSNDYVYCQSMTFVACANVIKYQNANPIFIDSEFETGNMCPEQLKISIEQNEAKGVYAKALILVHLFGIPAKIQKIRMICDDHGILLIEDAAEALGSSVSGKMCGTFGDFGVLSFNYNKIVSAGGGGALVCLSSEMKQKAMFYATQAKEKKPYYQHQEVGYNYRINHLQALLGNQEILKLDKFIEKRKKNFQFYCESLDQFSFIEVRKVPLEIGISNNWLTTILVNQSQINQLENKDIYNALKKEKIESRPLWKPMHLQPIYSNELYSGGAVSERLFGTGLCLPSGSNLTDEHRTKIEKVIFELFK